VSVHIKPCGKCRRARAQRPVAKRVKKNCGDCRWTAIVPPRLGRKSLGVFDTKGAAEAAFQEALVNHRRGIELLPSRLLVSSVMDRYLADGTGDLSVTTLHRYRELWNIHGSALAKFQVSDLRKVHITTLYARLQREPRGIRKPLNSRTVLHLHRVMHRAFKWAVDQDLVSSNIFAKVKPPKVQQADTRALTMEQASAFFGLAAGHRFEAFFLIAAMTGARRGELCGLKWEDVDLDSGSIVIRSSLASTRVRKGDRSEGAAATFLKGTKSGKSRNVPLDVDAVAALRRVKAAQAKDELRAHPGTYKDDGFVFADAQGGPVKLDAPTKAFREVAMAAGLPPEITLHSLRHSFASWSLANGGDIVAVQRVLGHSAPSTTLNLYSHVVAGQREKAVEAASDTLRRIQARRASGEK
jgi:integrase